MDLFFLLLESNSITYYSHYLYQKLAVTKFFRFLFKFIFSRLSKFIRLLPNYYYYYYLILYLFFLVIHLCFFVMPLSLLIICLAPILITSSPSSLPRISMITPNTSTQITCVNSSTSPRPNSTSSSPTILGGDASCGNPSLFSTYHMLL